MNESIVSQPKVLRCVSWCAVSSDAQASDDKESLPEQRQRNRQFIENLHVHYPGHDGELVVELEVVGSRSIIEFDAACTAYPRGYGKLRTLLEAGAVDAIVCRDTSRLGRKTALVTTIQAIATEHNCVVIPREGAKPSLNGDGSGDLLVSAIESSMGQLEVQALVRRRRMGMPGRVKNRRLFPAAVPYGYRYTYNEGQITGITTVPEEAGVVRRILVDSYVLAGMGSYAIADALTADGIPTPSGKDTWTSGMVIRFVRDARIYAGYLAYNRRSGAAYRNKAGLRRRPAPQPVIEVQGEHPPIITETELANVEAEKQTRTRAPRRRLFAGAAVCGRCGTALVGGSHFADRARTRTTPTMRCSNRNCSGVAISEHFLMDALLAAVENVENAAEDAELSAAYSQDTDGLENAKKAVEGRLEDLRRQRSNAVRLLVAETLTEDEFTDVANEIAQKVKAAEAELIKLDAQMAQALDAGRTSERIAEVRSAGRAILAEVDTAPDLVRGWIRRHFRLVVHPRMKGRNGASRIDVKVI